MNEIKKGIEPKKENVFLSLVFNILIPIIILKKGEDWFGKQLLGNFENTAIPVLIIAILFPIIYFIYDFIQRKKYNYISILGLVSVLLTGVIGIYELPPIWVAIKEAAIPFIIGLVIIFSLKTRYPLIRLFLLNPELMDVQKIESSIKSEDQKIKFDKLLRRCTYILGSSFILSAFLNYILARKLVYSPTGTADYNDQLSNLMAWSFPIIAIPCLIVTMYSLWILLKGIESLTGFKLEELIKKPLEK